jgi:hypothetical protein
MLLTQGTLNPMSMKIVIGIYMSKPDDTPTFDGFSKITCRSSIFFSDLPQGIVRIGGYSGSDELLT